MGDAAAERCDDFGWHPRGRIDATLVAEIAQHRGFGLGHAWSRSAGYTLTADPRRIYLVLTMEGGFEFTVDGAPVRTEPGSLVLLDGEVPTTARTLEETARFVWYLEPTFLHPTRSPFSYGEPIRTTGTSMQLLISMTNGLIGVPDPRTAQAQRRLALSFEYLLAAALHEAGTEHDRMAEHRDGLFMAALGAVESHFRDPAFDVTRMAREISASVRHLHTVFRTMGTTPRREIERRRVAEATTLAAATSISVSELAARSGFTSTQKLSRALSRSPTAVPPAHPRQATSPGAS